MKNNEIRRSPSAILIRWNEIEIQSLSNNLKLKISNDSSSIVHSKYKIHNTHLCTWYAGNKRKLIINYRATFSPKIRRSSTDVKSFPSISTYRSLTSSASSKKERQFLLAVISRENNPNNLQQRLQRAKSYCNNPRRLYRLKRDAKRASFVTMA